MTWMRRHLRVWAMAWGLLQATSLAALAPRACCISHAPTVHADTAEQSCHEAPKPDAHCPMRSAGGDACPMHATPAATAATATDEHQHQARPTDEAPQMTADATTSRPADCVMRSACNGPSPFTLFTHTGILPMLASTAAPPPSRVAMLPLAPLNTGLPSQPPDLRPPRA
ncbi:MAG TPA: hypothetical protein VMF13_09255 [Luteitalea sp.]|nr:hypothetical protein [Luteitalea sp.]